MVPVEHIIGPIGHIGDGFYGSYDPTDSVKALKEVVVLRIGFNMLRLDNLLLKHNLRKNYTVSQKRVPP